MKIIILMCMFSLAAICLSAQNCDSAAHVLFGEFASLHICSKSVKKMPEKYWGIAYELGDFSIRDIKNEVLYDFSSLRGNNYDIQCFSDSLIIYESCLMPFLREFSPDSGKPIIGPQYVYKYILTLTSAGYNINKKEVYKDYSLSPDSIKRVTEKLEDLINRYYLLENDIQAYQIKYQISDSLFLRYSDIEFYWLLFLGYYNNDKKCELYLNNYDKYIPVKTANPFTHRKIVENILWYKTLRKNRN